MALKNLLAWCSASYSFYARQHKRVSLRPLSKTAHCSKNSGIFKRPRIVHSFIFFSAKHYSIRFTETTLIIFDKTTIADPTLDQKSYSNWTTHFLTLKRKKCLKKKREIFWTRRKFIVRSSPEKILKTNFRLKRQINSSKTNCHNPFLGHSFVSSERRRGPLQDEDHSGSRPH